ncbi:hypothetical protein H4R33_004897 [Dimargaris cristalligena]|nr:hypothetical protein H4R33_004897 [Dimargaris cristalligena]
MATLDGLLDTFLQATPHDDAPPPTVPTPRETPTRTLVTGLILSRSGLLQAADRRIFLLRLALDAAYRRETPDHGSDHTDPGRGANKPCEALGTTTVLIYPLADAPDQHSQWPVARQIAFLDIRVSHWRLLSGLTIPCLVYTDRSQWAWLSATESNPSPLDLASIRPGLKPYYRSCQPTERCITAPPLNNHPASPAFLTAATTSPPPRPHPMSIKHSIIDYQGKVTRVLDCLLGLFELDRRLLLCLNRWPSYRPGDSIRVGSQLRIRDGQMGRTRHRLGFWDSRTGATKLPDLRTTPTEAKHPSILLTEGCSILWACSATHIDTDNPEETLPENKTIAPATDADLPCLIQSRIPPVYRVRLGIMDFLYLVDTLWFFENFGCPPLESDPDLNWVLRWFDWSLSDDAPVSETRRNLQYLQTSSALSDGDDMLIDYFLHGLADFPDSQPPPCGVGQWLYHYPTDIITARDLVFYLNQVHHFNELNCDTALRSASSDFVGYYGDYESDIETESTVDRVCMPDDRGRDPPTVLVGTLRGSTGLPLCHGALQLGDVLGVGRRHTIPIRIIPHRQPIRYDRFAAPCLNQVWAFRRYQIIREVWPRDQNRNRDRLDIYPERTAVSRPPVLAYVCASLDDAVCLSTPPVPSLLPNISTSLPPSQSHSPDPLSSEPHSNDTFDTDSALTQSTALFLPIYVHAPQLNPIPQDRNFLRAWVEGYCFPIDYEHASENGPLLSQANSTSAYPLPHRRIKIKEPFPAKFNSRQFASDMVAAPIAFEELRQFYLINYSTPEDSGQTKSALGTQDINSTTIVHRVATVTLVTPADSIPPPNSFPKLAPPLDQLKTITGDLRTNLHLLLDEASHNRMAHYWTETILPQGLPILPLFRVLDTIQSLTNRPALNAREDSAETSGPTNPSFGRLASFSGTIMDHRWVSVADLPMDIQLLTGNVRRTNVEEPQDPGPTLGLGPPNHILLLRVDDCGDRPALIDVYWDFRERVYPVGLLPGACVTFHRLVVQGRGFAQFYATNTTCSDVSFTPASATVVNEKSEGHHHHHHHPYQAPLTFPHFKYNPVTQQWTLPDHPVEDEGARVRVEVGVDGKIKGETKDPGQDSRDCPPYHPAKAKTRRSSDATLANAPYHIIAEYHRSGGPPRAPLVQMRVQVRKLYQLTLHLLCRECRGRWETDHVCYMLPEDGGSSSAAGEAVGLPHASGTFVAVWMVASINDGSANARLTVSRWSLALDLLQWSTARRQQLTQWLEELAHLDYDYRADPPRTSIIKPATGAGTSTGAGADAAGTPKHPGVARVRMWCDQYNRRDLPNYTTVPPNHPAYQAHRVILGPEATMAPAPAVAATTTTAATVTPEESEPQGRGTYLGGNSPEAQRSPTRDFAGSLSTGKLMTFKCLQIVPSTLRSDCLQLINLLKKTPAKSVE